MHQFGAGLRNFRLAMANYGFAGSSCAKAMEDRLFFDIGTNLVLGEAKGAISVPHAGRDKGARRGVECREAAIHPARSEPDGPPWGGSKELKAGGWGCKLRNEPNFSAKKPMKVHKCPKKRTQF
jgi:hypothetical protein